MPSRPLPRGFRAMTCSLPHRGGLWQGSDRDPIRRAFRKRRQTPSLNPHAGCLWKASSRNRRTHDIVRDAAPPGGVQGLRQDKPAREVEAERPAPSGSTDIAKPVPARTTTRARRSSAASSDDVLMGVTLSRPDKVLWPDDGEGAVNEAGPRPVFRGCRQMDDGAPPGTPVLDHRSA